MRSSVLPAGAFRPSLAANHDADARTGLSLINDQSPGRGFGGGLGL
jgi:hypothetical protein